MSYLLQKIYSLVKKKYPQIILNNSNIQRVMQPIRISETVTKIAFKLLNALKIHFSLSLFEDH